MLYFYASLYCGCCPERAAGRLPGEGHGVRGAAAPLHPLHPRTPPSAGAWKESLKLDSTPPAACRVGHRRGPSRPFRPGDVRACCGAPSALRAHGIAFAPAPSLQQEQERRGKSLRAAAEEGRRAKEASARWGREMTGRLCRGRTEDVSGGLRQS